jgi:hypothetical protein
MLFARMMSEKKRVSGSILCGKKEEIEEAKTAAEKY